MLEFPLLEYAGNLPSEICIKRHEAPKLQSPFKNFLQTGGSLVYRFEPPGWRLGGVMVLVL